MTPTPEDIAREAAWKIQGFVDGYTPESPEISKHHIRWWQRDTAIILEAIRSAVQAERVEAEALVNAELQTAAVSVSRGIKLGREEATRRYETVVEVLTRTLERLRSRGDK